MKKKTIAALALLLALFPAALGAGGSSEAAQAAKDTLRMAIAVDPDGLDPHSSASASTFQVTSSIYETLVTVDANGNLLPCLAESWTVASDGMSIEFDIRSGAAFSDGKACGAEEVAASFRRLTAPGSTRSQDYSFISDIEVVDDDTVLFSFSELDVNALSMFAYPWSAVVDTEKASSLRASPAGTGPYMLSSWVPQQAVRLTRNPRYTGEVGIGNVEFVVMPEMTTQVTALRNGQVDIILITGDLAGQFPSDQWNVLAFPGNGLQLMAINNKSGALSDPRVRQAINHAVDKDALIEAVWWGYGEKIGSHFPVVLSEYADMNGVWEYNPDRAGELLAEAGYADGLTLRLRLPRNYQEYVNAGLVIADQLKAAGINCEVDIVEWTTWLSDVYNGRDYDLTVVGHTGRLDAGSLLARFRSTAAENYVNYSNPDFDALLDEYSVTVDDEARREIARQMQETLALDAACLWIQDPIQIYVTAPDVEGFEIFPINIFKLDAVSFS